MERVRFVVVARVVEGISVVEKVRVVGGCYSCGG